MLQARRARSRAIVQLERGRALAVLAQQAAVAAPYHRLFATRMRTVHQVRPASPDQAPRVPAFRNHVLVARWCFVLGAAGLMMCGSRTELDSPPYNAGNDVADGADPDEGTYCSLRYGQVDACDAAGAPYILRCTTTFSMCSDRLCSSCPVQMDDAGPLWGCCNGQGSCGYAVPASKQACEFQ